MSNKNNDRDTIKVVCRIRPENHLELGGNYSRCVEYTEKNICVECQANETSNFAGRHDFAFDRIYGPDSFQKDVFEEVGAPIIKGILDGFNGTIFAYGQTGSGKTFTMEGPDHNDEDLKGMIPRMFARLFELIEEADDDIEFTVKVSYMEIYMEKIMDLLNPKNTNLLVRKDKTNGVFVKDCSEVYVSSPQEMLQIMKAGSENRSIAATRMNARSSRSHSLFVVTVFQKNTKNDNTKLGKLYCIDLAGSEKTMKTNATGQTLDEAKMINKSLSALGNVINALTEVKKSKHVPYRDSKLTQILQESIGGNSLTCLIITCSLSAYNDRETLSTLRFGNRAKAIKNKPIANAQRSAKELLGELDKVNSYVGKLEHVIKIVQEYLNTYFETENPDEKLIEDLKKIASTQDVKLIYALVKGEEPEENEQEDEKQEKDEDEEENQNENQNNEDETIVKTTETPVVEVRNKIPIEHSDDQKQEIARYEEELESATKEIAELNEKIIMLQVNHNKDRQDDKATIHELKESIEKLNIAHRNSNDLFKFKDDLERLRSDLELIKVSEKFNKSKVLKDNEENSEMGEVLDENLNEVPQDNSENSSTNVSCDRLALENIQKSIDIISKILNELGQQEIQTHKHIKINDNSNTATTIMHDISILAGAVGDNVVATREDSFLNSVSSDLNVSKFDENAVKYSVSASILEEKENRIKELKQIIESQNKNLISVNQTNQDLQDENEKLRSCMQDMVNKQVQNEITKDDDTVNDAEVEKLIEKMTKMEEDHKQSYVKLQDSYSDVKKAKDKIYEELVFSRRKADDQGVELKEKAETINKLEKQVIVLETSAKQSQIKLNQIVNGMPMNPMTSMNNMMGEYMVPSNINGHIEFNSYNNLHQSNANISMSNSHRGHNVKNPPSSFFSKKMNVVKPIRGGGKNKAKNVVGPASNPYESNNIANKEYNSVAHKKLKQSGKTESLKSDFFYKPPPTNHFAPVQRPNVENQEQVKPVNFKDFRRESKKMNYLSGFEQAKKMILDESMNPDESMNIDQDNSDEDDHEEALEDMMVRGEINNIPGFAGVQLNSNRTSMGSKTTKGAQNKNDNLFKPKQKGFMSALMKYIKN